MKTNFKNPIVILAFLLGVFSCGEIDLYDESVIINNALSNDDATPIVSEDITLSYVTSIDNGLANNTLRFLVNLSPNIDINAIINLGIVYSETEEPDLSDGRVSTINISETNTIDVNSLLEGQMYYFRAYMITTQGVFYSFDEVSASVPETNCSIMPEDNHVNEWYYLIEPEQNVYISSDLYEITVLSPGNFNFSNQYEIYLYLNENQIQYIANGLDFDSAINTNGVLNYTYNFSIPEGLTPSSCYTIRIIPASWSNEDDTAVSNSFMILQ